MRINSIRAKLFIIILGPAFLLLIVIFQNYRNLNALGGSAERILSKNYKSIKAADLIRQHLEHNLSAAVERALGKTDHARAGAFEGDIPGLLEICRSNVTEHGEEKIITELIKKL